MKKAFTLAEVLITLAIIGVVAALTLPSLIANHQKKVWVTQLQVAVNTWNNGFKKMMSDDEVEYLSATEFARSTESTNWIYILGNDQESNKILKKYFNILKVTDPTPSNPQVYTWLNSDEKRSTSSAIIYLNNGVAYMFESIGFERDTGRLAAVMIDINGKKGPNKMGRDLFNFWLNPRGELIAQGSKAAGDIGDNSHWTDNDVWGCGESSSHAGSDCAARIIENGWVMDY